MPISNYPKGFAHGITVRGMPVLNTYSGKIFWVDSQTGSNQNRGTFDRPWSTLDSAFDARNATQGVKANRGDMVMVKAGHSETISGAAGVNMDVAGVSVICLGEGADRPTFTFSATASTITMTAASCSILGFPIFIPSIDSVVSPLVISAADCRADIEVKDASDTVECIRAVLTTAAADRVTLNVKYLGRTGGNACVNCIRLVGGDGARVDVDFYGIASTAAVEFLTTACTDVNVTGYVYNSGTTDGSKLVIDTVSGSTWYVDIRDGAAAARFTGGSGAAIASDDISTIAGLHTVPAQDATTDVNMRDVVGKKDDTASTVLATTDSLVSYAKGLMTSTVRVLTTSAVGIQQTPKTLFTITGGSIHIISIVGTVVTAIQGQATTQQLQAVVTTPSATINMSTAVETNADVVGVVYTFVGPTGILTPTDVGLVLIDQGSTTVTLTQWIVPIGLIGLDGGATSTGDVDWVMTYYHNPAATVVAA